MSISSDNQSILDDSEEERSILDEIDFRDPAFLNPPVSDPEARAALNIFEASQTALSEFQRTGVAPENFKTIQAALDNFEKTKAALDVLETPEAALDVIQTIQAALNDWKTTGTASTVFDAMRAALDYFATTGDAPVGFRRFQPFYCLPPPPPPSPNLPLQGTDLFQNLQHDAIAGMLENGLFEMTNIAPKRILHLGPLSMKWISAAGDYLRNARVVCVASENGLRRVFPRIQFLNPDELCQQGETYDFVFIRDILPVSAQANTMYLAQKAFSLLDPSGYLEIQTVECDKNDCDLPELFFQRSGEEGEPIMAVVPWESFLKEAGFEDVTTNLITCGKEFTHNFGDFLPKLLTEDSLRDMATMLAEALKDPEMETALRLKIVRGRKPNQ